MPYQELGSAPSKHGHAQVHIKCDTCGDLRTLRASTWRSRGASHTCKAVVTAKDPAPAWNALANPAEQLQDMQNDLADLGARVDCLADLATRIASLSDLGARVDSLTEQLASAVDRITELERLATFVERPAPRPHGMPFPGERPKPFVDTPVALGEPISIRTLKHGISDPATQKKAYEASHKRALELAYMSAEFRTPRLKEELRQRKQVVVEILDTMQTKHPDYTRLSEINLKLAKAYSSWDTPGFDLAIQLHEEHARS